MGPVHGHGTYMDFSRVYTYILSSKVVPTTMVYCIGIRIGIPTVELVSLSAQRLERGSSERKHVLRVTKHEACLLRMQPGSLIPGARGCYADAMVDCGYSCTAAFKVVTYC